MKKPLPIVFLLLILCFVTSMKAQESTTDRIVLSDLTAMSSPGVYYFDVSLAGSRIYTAYNMDITFPEGIDVAKSGNNYLVSMVKPSIYPFDEDYFTQEKTYSHTVSVSMPNEHQLRLACSSNVNAEFTANSGALLRVAVTLDDSKFTFSPKPIVKVSGIALVQKDGTKYVPVDFNCRPFTTGIPAARELPINISATNKVGSLILPFDAELPSGVKAYKFSYVDEVENKLNLVAADCFEACEPYIVYAENGYSGNIGGTVDYTAEYPDEDVYTDGGLTGVLSATVVNTGYIMQNKGDGPQFYRADGQNFSLPAGRCYMTIPPSNVRSFSFDFDDTTTNIDALGNEELKTDVWYTLQGVKLDQMPTETGIYIQGNKKVVIP